MVSEFLSKKFFVSEYVWIDGWTAAHFLLGVIVATTPIGALLFDAFSIPKYSLIVRFLFFSLAFEAFEVIVGRLTKYRVFKEPGVDIVWDLVANITGFVVGLNLL